ncbi:serine/threonine protein phosphatase 2A 57 kDa regulatory subunit B' beta isoform-like [Andrographis paniculata]|uniref:serine/threonine protein phosphatase 2A 57 kDa regulatory subunit B' beta isoform-like n=1 Tax=Andrographis paniculata TaxID=175694 RepID=UPI0021E91F8F|nr:serine/threonine protein phosphatase 2A 57 kDa regulatory subunit B' beta isoform-like [Andrographis paniculata]
MFNRIMKRGHKKPSKPEAVETPVPTTSPLPNVTVNHASRATAPAPQPAQPVSHTVVPPNPGVVEVLPMVKDVPLPERHAMFIRKLQVCCISFDFADTMKSVREKEIKRQTLSELVELVHSGSFKMNEIMQEQLINMISINIFRPLPPAAHETTGAAGGDPEEEEIYMEPAWPHLQIVYELLLRYIVSSDTDIKIAKRYIDHSFVLKMLGIFDSEDPREREYLKTVVHRVYARFMIHRPFIRSSINNILCRYMFETERYNGIVELLDIISSVITGLVLPIKEEHKLFLVRVLIPLHKSKGIASFHQQLSCCITQFVEKDYRLADIVIKGVLKYWPLSNCGKEVLFLGEIEEILEATQSPEFQRCMVPLFRQVARCINSPHFQVAERALFMWNNEQIVGLVAENRHVILPIIFSALEHNIQDHWNQAISGLTTNVRRMFLEMDAELFEECQQKHEEKEASAGAVEERRLSTWRRLEEAAGAHH